MSSPRIRPLDGPSTVVHLCLSCFGTVIGGVRKYRSTPRLVGAPCDRCSMPMFVVAIPYPRREVEAFDAAARAARAARARR